MEFRIADTFTDALAKLTAQEQKAALEFARANRRCGSRQLFLQLLSTSLGAAADHVEKRVALVIGSGAHANAPHGREQGRSGDAKQDGLAILAC